MTTSPTATIASTLITGACHLSTAAYHKAASHVTTRGLIVVGAAVAAPMAVPLAVAAVGFGAGGIAAGTWAAWAMSLGAGSTPAVVAACQSIGAAGLSGAATALTAITGAAAAHAGLPSHL